MIPIKIRSNSIDGDVGHFAECRIRFALDRMRNLRRVSISIEDVNGPKGGPDKRCCVVADFTFGSIVVLETQEIWQTAVARAIHRVARSATRELQRLHRLSAPRLHFDG
ncbi:MAG TPA: hypothetical protein VKB38_04900 [Terracidiphilus sp.]|nr:hypothetical protein [Terracidiphilus sp.]